LPRPSPFLTYFSSDLHRFCTIVCYAKNAIKHRTPYS
jgi:hypothetical protein